MPESTDRLLTLTVQIVTACVGANAIDMAAVPGLIRDIFRSLAGLEADSIVSPAKSGPGAALRPTAGPAAAIRKSVFADHLVCLEDGQKMAMLKRHLRTAHDMTPEQYRAKWSLPTTYPMVSPDYAKVRSRLAKESGLGQPRTPGKARGS